jgi:phage baseplate assembly protein W
MAANQKGLVQQTRITRTPYFVGFNTVGQPNPPYSLTNIELVKRDINNQFATPLGSRLMLPNFGTRIFEYLFDPFDQYTKNAIIEDAVNVIQSEPRVELVNIDVYQEDQTLTVAMSLMFRPESITESLFVTFSLTDKESF